MKKIPVLTGLAMSVLCFLLPLAASAAQFKTGQEVSTPTGVAIMGNLYMAGGNVSSAAVVRGDLVTAGGTLLINGAVSNDILAAGGNISILSDVGGDVRVAGGNIAIQGKIAGDVVVGGGQVSISGAGVGGDVAIGGGNITLNAPVAGDLKAGGGQVTIDAPVHGNVDVKANKLVLGPNAVINGNLTYTASEEASIATGATVHGQTNFTKSETGQGKAPPAKALATFITLALVAKFFMLLVGAFAFYLIFPRYAQDLVTSAAAMPLANLGKGFVVFVVFPVASLILCITIIGAMLGVLGFLGFAAFLIFASIAAAIFTGSLVHKWIWKPAGYVVNWKTILMGVVIYFLLGLVPFLGWLVKFCIMLIVLGVVISYKWDATKSWR